MQHTPSGSMELPNAFKTYDDTPNGQHKRQMQGRTQRYGAEQNLARSGALGQMQPAFYNPNMASQNRYQYRFGDMQEEQIDEGYMYTDSNMAQENSFNLNPSGPPRGAFYKGQVDLHRTAMVSDSSMLAYSDFHNESQLNQRMKNFRHAKMANQLQQIGKRVTPKNHARPVATEAEVDAADSFESIDPIEDSLH